jgi:polyferredoxin
MAKVGRKPGLVRYASEESLAGRQRRILRPRLVLYGVVLTALCSLLAWRVASREDVLASSLRPRVLPVFEADPQGRPSVRALVPVALVNRTDRDLTVTLALDPALDAHLIVPGDAVTLPPNTRREVTGIAYLPRARMPAGYLDTRLSVVADGRTVGTTAIVIPHP